LSQSKVRGRNLPITGESYRLREKRKSGLIRSRLTNVDPEQTHGEMEVKIKKEPDGGVNNRYHEGMMGVGFSTVTRGVRITVA